MQFLSHNFTHRISSAQHHSKMQTISISTKALCEHHWFRILLAHNSTLLVLSHLQVLFQVSFAYSILL